MTNGSVKEPLTHCAKPLSLYIFYNFMYIGQIILDTLYASP